MRILIFAALALPAFAEGAGSLFTTTRGTESIEVLGGIAVNHVLSGTPVDPQTTVRLRGGVSRYLSGTFDFNYQPLRGEYRNSIEQRESFIFIAGGTQVHAPLGRVEPYLLGQLGTFRDAVKASGLVNVSREAYRFSQAAGAGVRIGVHRYLGFSVEVRAVHVQDFGWISQYGVGLWTAIGGR